MAKRKYTKKKKISIWGNINRFLIYLGVGIIVLGYFGNFFYIFDIFSHFYLQYGVLGTILLFTSIVLRDKISIAICIFLLPFIGYQVYEATFKIGDYTGNVDYYYLNANYFTYSPKEIIEDIKKYNPKHIAIVELNKELYQAIQQEFQFETAVYYSGHINSFGFFTNQEVIKQQIHELTYPIGEFKTSDTTIYVVHPLPGLNGEYYKLQKKNFSEIKKLYQENLDKQKLILGDLNSTYYSQVFQKYFGELYYKPIYSWGVDSILRIPIDYAIGNKNFYHVYGGDLKVSDHIPLLIKLK